MPRRLTWAVELVDPAADDEILEIGCGPGVAADLVCARLTTGHLTAIDRSAVAIARAGARNAAHLAAGRMSLRQAELIDLPPDRRFDKVFAVNVNVFWTRPDDTAAARVAGLLRPGGELFLVYGPAPDPGEVQGVAQQIAARLRRQGLRVSIVDEPSGSVCVRGQAPPAGSAR